MVGYIHAAKDILYIKTTISVTPSVNIRMRRGKNKSDTAEGQRHHFHKVVFNICKERISMSVHRGEIYYADLSPVIGSEQGGIRPVLIVQNDVGNRHSPTVIAAAITSRSDKAKLPTHIRVGGGECGLAKDSIVLLEQIRTLDKRRLKERMGELDSDSMNRVNSALSISFGLE